VSSSVDPLGPNIRWGSAQGRWIMLATILGFGLSMLDSTVVTVALPALGVAHGATLGDPLLGGWKVETIGWRWVFLINLPLAVIALVITLRHVPETADPALVVQHQAVGGFGALAAGSASLPITIIMLCSPVRRAAG